MVRTALSTVRRAGWRAVALSVLSFLPSALAVAAGLRDLLIVALMLQVVVTLALVRNLAAWRLQPVPPPPLVGEAGERAGRLSVVLPVAEADRSVQRSLRAAVSLLRPALRLAALQILFLLGAALALAALGGDRLVDRSGDTPRPSAAALLAAIPLFAFVLAFIQVAPQRIALEGDPRVLVAVAHSVRVAKANYGPLFLLALLQPALDVGATALTSNPGLVQVLAVAVIAVLLRIVVTAISTELWLAGPRLDVPASFGSRTRG